MRRLPIGVSGALGCCIRASEKVVSFDTHSLSAGPDLPTPCSERPRARQLAGEGGGLSGPNAAREAQRHRLRAGARSRVEHRTGGHAMATHLELARIDREGVAPRRVRLADGL